MLENGPIDEDGSEAEIPLTVTFEHVFGEEFGIMCASEEYSNDRRSDSTVGIFVHMFDGCSARVTNDTDVDMNCSIADGMLPIFKGS